MKLKLFPAILIATASIASCSHKATNTAAESMAVLADSLQAIADGCPGEMGIALITDEGDTLALNNEAGYPMMSVFKLHQAIALCHALRERGQTPDSLVTLNRSELNPDTWSPMLADHKEQEIRLPLSALLSYTLGQSDNNASNYLFDRLQSVAEADSLIATLIPRESFRMACSEEQMWSDHSICYSNFTSPLGAALLVERLYSDSTFLHPADRQMIIAEMLGCATGADRIAAPLADKDGVSLAHKTGSGFRNAEGVLTAHNDVGRIQLPDGRHYTLAIFVKDFHGTETEASAHMAKASETVYQYYITRW